MLEDSQKRQPEAVSQAAEFPKVYEPGLIEPRWAEAWVEQEIFRADSKGHGEVFSIVIPPPNVTGYIHVGHMLEHTQIDALTRWHRMRGERTLWLPGMDHAGISTQVVVERELAKQNLARQALGREEFERRVWEWKAHSGGTIKKQMIRLGDSCDWSREKFTLDRPLYRAVLEAFLRLYHEGLIYRGRYIVNWCPRCQTALSDLETVHEERNGHLWHIRYPVVGSSESVVVATTRPETMLGDTAVAVNPEDERYKHLAGKKLLLPLMNREIPVIADAAVDREFGTGAVKVTPAHDPNDFEMGRRHKLPEIDVMTEDGHMNVNAGAYAGLDRFEARKRVVTDLESQGLLVKVEHHSHAVGICDRCKTVIEPRVSMQWFCKMRPLAEAGIAAVESGEIRIVPENQRKIFLDWLTNIRDWCISRQLWWGHRIPIWHCPCGGITPARDSRVAIVDGRALPASPPMKCAKCGGGKLEQDPDVLDTWFSSGLWPLSTLGWPDETADLRAFYPTTLLISGYDILFFWDARMVMLCLHLAPGKTTAERIPFRTLHLHGLVRDAQGQKMSKMRGNVVDPLEWMERYGTDALRFTLAIKAAPGTDIALSEEAVSGYKAFANKIWNAARFVFVNLEKFQAATRMSIEELASPQVRAAAPYPVRGAVSLADRWIFSRLAEAIATIDDALENFRFHEAAHIVYHFFWGDFCDWYIEWVKPAMADADREVAVPAWRNLFAVLEEALRLLHPLMPFLTEELWHRLPQRAPAEDKNARSIALQPFPRPAPQWSDPDAEEEVRLLQEVIVAARNVRAELKLDPKRRVAADFAPASDAVRTVIENNRALVLRLATLSDLHFSDAKLEPSSGPVRSTAQFDLRIAHRDGAESGAEVARLRKEIDRLVRDVESKQNRLADSTFRNRAPAEIVRQLEATLAERRIELNKITDRLTELERGGQQFSTSSKMPSEKTPAWRNFEKLIAQIEAAMAPSGAVLKSPDRIPDKVTGELREVDASIRYRVGTAPILITIECRDRSGSEDVRWIEQLAEKKRSIGASITLAVSSSGFTEPAVKKAEMSGIEVRSLHDATATDFTQWLTTQKVVIDSIEWSLSGLALELYDAPEDAELSPASQQNFRASGAGAPILVRNSDGRHYSIENILIDWNKHNPNWTHDVPADGTRTLRNLHQPLERGGLHVETSRGNFDVRVIHMSLSVTRSKSEVFVSQLKEYRDASTPLVQTALWNIAENHKLSIHRDLKSGVVKVVMMRNHE